MPIVKTKHEDIIRKNTFDAILKNLSELEQFGKPVVYEWKGAENQLHTENIVIHYPMIRAMLCLLFLFGKRISEILPLKRGDFYTRSGYLFVRFRILKKPSRAALMLPVEKVKRVSMRNQSEYVNPIINYLNTLQNAELPLFPGNSKPHRRIVKRKNKETGETIKEYQYEIKHEGLLSREQAFKILKALHPEAYPHWFRHSLATALAEEGFTAHELKDWFDWSRYSTAQSYVEGMPSMTQRISSRKIH